MRRLLVGALVLACAGCEGRPNRFPLNFDRMRDQPRYDAYERSSYFADAKTMREPPEGTIAVEAVAAATDRPADLRAITSIPVAMTADRLRHGQNRYDVFCRPCHDVDGSADSPVARNMQLRRPPSLLEPRIRQLPIGRIYQAIAEGYGLMPSYAAQLDPDERWAVAAYVRALQLRTRVDLATLSPAVQAEAAQALAAGSAR
jgi:mono/diheme cytochrome c family protein